MRLTMVFGILLAAFAVGCGEDETAPPPWDDRPFDGFYYVGFERSSSSCYDAETPESQSMIDLRLRQDGLYDLEHHSIFVPGRAVYDGLERLGGNLDIERGVTDSYGGVYSYWIKGRATPDEFNAEIGAKNFLGNDCVEKVRLVGVPVPLTDPLALDGYYRLTQQYLGSACSDGTVEEGGKPWESVVSFFGQGNGAYLLTLAENVLLDPDAPALDGTLDWSGTIYISDGWGYYDFPVRLKGVMRPDGVDLAMAYDVDYAAYFGIENGATCTYSYTLQGAKRLPSVAAVDNHYRLHYVIHDTCTDDPEKVDWELNTTGSLMSIEAGGGTWVLLEDAAGQMWLPFDGANLSGGYGHPSVGYTVSYEGTVTPPHLNYVIRSESYDEAGNVLCTFEAVADGTARFVF